MSQTHLNKKDMINLGAYYTKPALVDFAYNLIEANARNLQEYTILDSSCGYGSFLSNAKIAGNRKIGADIDNFAVSETKKNATNTETICHNSLTATSRENYRIAANEKLIIVGNPPYNDITSIIRNEIKSFCSAEVIGKYKARDLGISFLRSYSDLSPDFVCVLHPLSYLIKKANFDSLGEFAKNYKLLDSVVVSSAEFNGTAPGKTYFPIVIALYKKDRAGMKYSDIENFEFATKEGGKFKISSMISIKNFLSKYPNQRWVKESEAIAKFYTMRDINALKRSRTFIDETTYNTIFVPQSKLAYYCYVDIFKKHIAEVPYYFGNCDVFIDNDEFSKIKGCFIYESAKFRPELQRFVSDKIDNAEQKINGYFRNLLGEHYVQNHN